MRSPVYFYGPRQWSPTAGTRPLALVSVEYLDAGVGLVLPPVVEWEGVLYYWSEERGGYCAWLSPRDVPKIGGHDLVNDFRRR